MSTIYLIIYLFIILPTNLIGFEINLPYGKNYSNTINNGEQHVLNFINNKSNTALPPRVSISLENTYESSLPLFVVARQNYQLLSWRLPYIIMADDDSRALYPNASHTLCPHSSNDNDGPNITLSTSSFTNLTYNIRVDEEIDFNIKPSIYYNFTISPSEPRYYFYNFTNITLDRNVVKSNYDMVLLEIYSSDTICTIISVQNATCPVFDTNEDITYRGYYETITTKGGITIPRNKFPNGFFVVFVVRPDDNDCSEIVDKNDTERTKKIEFIIKPSITYADYEFAVIITISFIFTFQLIFGTIFYVCTKKSFKPHEIEEIVENTACNSVEPDGNDTPAGSTDMSDDYDTTIDQFYHMNVTLSELSRRHPRAIVRKSYLYLYNTLTVSLFYGLPAVQLVVTYQRMLNQTGEQDLCYYNFLCAHPLGVISDFNHIFSNVGYITFGGLFLWIVYWREQKHQNPTIANSYGIPQHYGLFYAMGVALIMEGILSGSYHVCPTNSNFQFDSSFMYVMAVLSMVKLYQNRHPDVNASAYSTFGVLAIAILLCMIGITRSNLLFWIIFTIIHIFGSLYLSFKIYYMGRWYLNVGQIIRCYHIIRTDYRTIFRPMYKARLCLLIIANLCNWALDAYSFMDNQINFAIYLLCILMGNTLIYFFFYIIMKIICNERVNYLTIFFLLLSILSATSSMYFFSDKSISWSKTPAESRHFNQECKLMSFYDYHDIWHFLSAIGMFFTFMVLLTLDDDLTHRHRDDIAVF